MDNFMDKLAQRFNAQEMIKANSQAEAKELERLRQQTEMYDGYLKEMRSLNLKNVEVAEQITQMAGQIQKLTDQAVEKIAGMQEVAGKEQVQAMIEKLGQLQDDIVAAKQQAEESGKQLEDFMHKESVKVYRNVQAAVSEELSGKVSELTDKLDQKGKLPTSIYVLEILGILLMLGNLGVLIVHILGILLESK